MSDPALLSVGEVAHRLGVKRETVYAYVSRGLLERHPASAHRRSLFEREAVQQLATRARSGDRSDALEVVVETQVTLLDPDGRLFYRGQDAAELARFSTFERVAGLLWGGPAGAPWELDAASAAIVGRLAGVLPANAPAVDRIPVVIGALGAADPLRSDRRPAAVRRTAGRILAGALDGLPAAVPSSDRSAAARLWAALSPESRPPRPVQLAALDACLILLADHELAASTLAARVAASAWADPYRVVLAGLGPLGGALHGASRSPSSRCWLRSAGPRPPSPRWSGWSRRVARRPGSATASTATAIRAQTTCSRASARPRSTPVRLGPSRLSSRPPRRSGCRRPTSTWRSRGWATRWGWRPGRRRRSSRSPG